MANPEHLKILKQGVEVWSRWRKDNPDVCPDLSSIDLQSENFFHEDFTRTDFSNSNLSGADFGAAILIGTNFSNATLNMADFTAANLSESNLSNASLIGAQLCLANLYRANLENVNLVKADISGAQLIKTNLKNAKLLSARVYGISSWDIEKTGLIQRNLIITFYDEPEITVDDLEVAQFIYLMLNNEKIRDVIETITSKAVLILGRFTEERKKVLDALKDELRRRNYLPIVFDFENAGNKSVDETVNLLARMSRFVVADITDAKSIPQELRGIVPNNPSVPIVPLILDAQHEYGMFDFFTLFRSVLPLYRYESPEILLHNIIPAIITPAEQKVAELHKK